MKFRVYPLRIKEKPLLKSMDVKSMKRVFCVPSRRDSRKLISEVLCGSYFSLFLNSFHRTSMEVRSNDTKFTRVIINNSSHQSYLHKEILITRKVSDIRNFLVFDNTLYIMDKEFWGSVGKSVKINISELYFSRIIFYNTLSEGMKVWMSDKGLHDFFFKNTFWYQSK
jgi:hypothetical protein